jgi:Holliday junction resolvase RusA-like endonuclease
MTIHLTEHEFEKLANANVEPRQRRRPKRKPPREGNHPQNTAKSVEAVTRGYQEQSFQNNPLTIVLTEIPPTVNHMYTKTRRGVHLTKEARGFRDRTIAEVQATALGEQWFTHEQARYRLSIGFTFGNHRRVDIDNRVKALLDAIAAALGFDDKCIDEIRVKRVGVAKNEPLTVVRLDIL